MTAVDHTSRAGRATEALEELRVNPFEALRVSFGMLLGEDDFHTLMGNPRGKQMLHTSWLHGSGVVWGYPVDRDEDGKLRVGPGLAVDGRGRELALHEPYCLDVDAWARDQRRKGTPAGDKDDPCADPPVSTACLVARFDLCPTRPVPALADPCDLQRTSTETSRLIERVHLELLPGDCPVPAGYGPYHRVRVLLGLDEVGPKDKAGEQAAKALADVLKEPRSKRTRALLRAFRQLLAYDVTDLGPEPGELIFPVPEDDAAVPLARITLDRAGKPGYPAGFSWEADITVRRGLVATSTIQELTCGLAPGVLGGRAGRDAGGPRVVRGSLAWTGDGATLVFRVTSPLRRATLTRKSVLVSSLGPGGWDTENIDDLQYDGQETVRVKLYAPPSQPLVRLVVRGTGPTPVTGTTGIPLAGVDDGDAGTIDDGNDAVLRLERSAP
jgi:hypothetical protein